jgi:hypothetical protein
VRCARARVRDSTRYAPLTRFERGAFPRRTTGQPYGSFIRNNVVILATADLVHCPFEIRDACDQAVPGPWLSQGLPARPPRPRQRSGSAWRRDLPGKGPRHRVADGSHVGGVHQERGGVISVTSLFFRAKTASTCPAWELEPGRCRDERTRTAGPASSLLPRRRRTPKQRPTPTSASSTARRQAVGQCA